MVDKNILIVGGTSGLGLKLSKKLKNINHVFVVGRHDPNVSELDYIHRDLSYGEPGVGGLIEFINEPIELLIFASGFYQEGSISQLSDDDVMAMLHVGLTAPITLISRILKRQNFLPGLIVITSTSQFIPRPLEPVYTVVKSGLGMFANSISLDPAIGKALVAAPAGMKTPFWHKDGRDTNDMLDPEWVAEQILDLYDDEFKYKYAHILRSPPRVEVVEKR
ncbi:MAG: SDR family NAD(P)-dependent oxidoreductase [Patescibacteria group bacterium]